MCKLLMTILVGIASLGCDGGYFIGDWSGAGTESTGLVGDFSINLHLDSVSDDCGRYSISPGQCEGQILCDDVSDDSLDATFRLSTGEILCNTETTYVLSKSGEDNAEFTCAFGVGTCFGTLERQ